jgi:hypothetical protein
VEHDHILSPTLNVFQFVGQHHRFFKAMLGNRGYGVFAKPIYDYLFAHIHTVLNMPMHAREFAHMQMHFKRLNAQERASPLGREVAAHYFASALMGVLIWWLEKDKPCTAEEVDALFRQLAMPGFISVLEASLRT